MTSSIRLAAMAVASVVCSTFVTYAAPLEAASFQVELKRLSAVQCGLTGSMLAVDPNTGNVTIDLDADATCYPASINALNLNASLVITTPLSVGGGTTGEGTVGLQLNTGLATSTNGVTCVSDGFVATNVNITSGWPATLCTNCGPTAVATIGVQHAGLVGNGSISFKAKCTYQDPAHPNLQTVRSNIQTASAVTVVPGTIPTPTSCSSVTQLANPRGLTDAKRQTTGTVQPTGGAPSSRSLLQYTTLFGTSSSTYPAGAADTALYGFPGTITGLFYTITLESGKYVALQFRAPSDPLWLQRWGEYFAGGYQSYTRASIAPCPGQFSEDSAWPTSGVCFFDGTKNSAPKWEVTNGSTTRCKLEPGKVYYLNVIHAYDNDPTESSCGASSCKFEIRNNHSY